MRQLTKQKIFKECCRKIKNDESGKSIVDYLRKLKELGFLYSPFLKPILQSVFGNVSYAEPPITEAEYQLSLYDYKQQSGQDPNILYDLIYFTIEYCQDPLNNPLTGVLALPKEMRE